jgi:pimeloyl-ACP methyl ester carboxylesterase
MPKARINNIEIEYETFGDPSRKPLLLISGLGAQMITYIPEFCDLFVKEGFYVIRFDNRDVGLSTKFDEKGVPNVLEAIIKLRSKQPFDPPYHLEDMADDAVGLLDFLKIEEAHILGASLGSMIAQVVAYRHPSRVSSLILIMGTTSNPDLPEGKPETIQLLMTPMPAERESYIEESVKRGKVLYGSGFPYDEELRRKLAEEAYDRCYYPDGQARQLVAGLVNGDRRDRIKKINVPTLVIHGEEDPLFSVECGIDLSENIPGAKLLIINGMGHSLPPETWPEIINAVVNNTAQTN